METSLTFISSGTNSDLCEYTLCSIVLKPLETSAISYITEIAPRLRGLSDRHMRLHFDLDLHIRNPQSGHTDGRPNRLMWRVLLQILDHSRQSHLIKLLEMVRPHGVHLIPASAAGQFNGVLDIVECIRDLLFNIVRGFTGRTIPTAWCEMSVPEGRFGTIGLKRSE